MRVSIHRSYRKNKLLDKNLHILKNKIGTLTVNIQNLMSEVNRFKSSCHRLNQECSALQNNCQQQNTIAHKFKLQQDVLEKDLLKIKQKLEDIHYGTLNGSLIWIIDEFQRKFRAAQLGQQTSIYSPLICTSPNGYQIRARLDLNGNGDACGTHMSIFIIIYKGEYDAILVWPFPYQVTFCLFDQTGEGRHVIDSFHPDATSASFQRPSSEENIPSGIPKFFPLAVLQHEENVYVPNDKMYIKVVIDFLETPRPILPYTSDISPALPTVQQDALRLRMIEQYKKMRAKIVAHIEANDREVASRSLKPMYPPVPARIVQQPPIPPTNSESTSYEEMLPE